MKLLKQTTSGEIYVWDENLAKREDMVEFEREAKPVAKAVEVEEVETVEVPAPAPVKKGKK